MTRFCEVCGSEFAAQRSTARYCSSRCRGRAAGLRKRGVAIGGETPPAPPEAPAEQHGVLAAVERQLAAADKLDDWRGQLATTLADRLQRSYADNASSVAALSKELDRVMTAHMADAKPEPDALDHLVADVIDMRDHPRRRDPRRGR